MVNLNGETELDFKQFNLSVGPALYIPFNTIRRHLVVWTCHSSCQAANSCPDDLSACSVFLWTDATCFISCTHNPTVTPAAMALDQARVRRLFWACDAKWFRVVVAYFNYRADASVHCSDSASEKGSKPNQFQDSCQIMMVDSIKTFPLIKIDQSPIEVSFVLYVLYYDHKMEVVVNSAVQDHTRFRLPD